ncbi:hypothetical protein [Antricoccus suffuscus]|uniref:hypothetical protein n=1 Tax=Antricoccus suffuscus TaxID=1629062 RepID=UPI00147353BF|nr:hypothetical protein [Antricoccus suffuscus]
MSITVAFELFADGAVAELVLGAGATELPVSWLADPHPANPMIAATKAAAAIGFLVVMSVPPVVAHDERLSRGSTPLAQRLALRARGFTTARRSPRSSHLGAATD